MLNDTNVDRGQPRPASSSRSAAKSSSIVLGAPEPRRFPMTARKSTTAPAPAKRTRKSTPAPAAVVEVEPADLSTITNSELGLIASREWEAQKAAKKAGTTIPAAPHLDELNRRHAAGVVVKKDKSGKAREPKVEVQFYRGGKPMPESQNALSSLAYQATRGIGGPDTVRISTTALIELLGTLGVDKPSSTSWAITLPNGVMLACRVKGDETPVPQPEPKLAASTSKSAAPAKKAAPAKAAAKKATPARKQTAKSTSAKKVAAATSKRSTARVRKSA